MCDVHISTNGGIAIGESRSSSSKPLGLPAPSDSLPPLPHRFPSPSATSLFFLVSFFYDKYTPPTALAATSAATPTACRPLDSWRADLLTGAAFQKDSTRRCHQRHVWGTRGVRRVYCYRIGLLIKCEPQVTPSALARHNRSAVWQQRPLFVLNCRLISASYS